METTKDFNSILPFLPLVSHSSSSFIWPAPVLEVLAVLSKGSDYSSVYSGEVLFLTIINIRSSLGLSGDTLSPSAADGYALFFDKIMPRDEAKTWFVRVIPAIAMLLLRLPALLETNFHYASLIANGMKVVQCNLRLLKSQQQGIVFLSQELAAALLACSLLCILPSTNRSANHLPATINMDNLFGSLCDIFEENQVNKIKCIVHYFERISSYIPAGFISFERKVFHFESELLSGCYPNSDFWRKSTSSLCPLVVYLSQLIEDQTNEALEVDFANKYIGGGTLSRGCVQEEIRFMINPELIVGRLFLTSMDDNEAIEILGVERFSNYTGYASSFTFSGDHMDNKNRDSMGRKKTRIIAIDALCNPGTRQYSSESLLREVNKAFCGFSVQLRCLQFKGFSDVDKGLNDFGIKYGTETSDKKKPAILGFPSSIDSQYMVSNEEVGVATGNWGCGAFGGDPGIKAIIQWLAASQASRPFMSYHIMDKELLQCLEQASKWIMLQKWTVGELWQVLVEYSIQRLNGTTKLGFFEWLLPSPPQSQ